MEDKQHIRTRQRLKRHAAKRMKVKLKKLAWIRGRLIYLVTGKPVRGVPEVHKPTHEAGPTTSKTKHARTRKPRFYASFAMD
jgi:hypothetical protein